MPKSLEEQKKRAADPVDGSPQEKRRKIIDPREDDYAKLKAAIQKGDVAAINEILDEWEDIDDWLNDTEEDNPLHWAIRTGDPAIVELLLKKGIQQDILGESDDNSYSCTPLELAMDSAKIASTKMLIVQMLLDNGAEYDQDENSNPSLFFQAVLNDYLEILGEFLTRGVTIDCQDAHGDTALHVAARANNMEAMLMLVKYGPSANLKNKAGKTALHVAAEGNNEAAVRLLLAIGANPELPDNAGKIAHDLTTSPKIKEYIQEFLRARQQHIVSNGVEGLEPIFRTFTGAHAREGKFVFFPPPREENKKDAKDKGPKKEQVEERPFDLVKEFLGADNLPAIIPPGYDPDSLLTVDLSDDEGDVDQADAPVAKEGEAFGL